MLVALAISQPNSAEFLLGVLLGFLPRVPFIGHSDCDSRTSQCEHYVACHTTKFSKPAPRFRSISLLLKFTETFPETLHGAQTHCLDPKRRILFGAGRCPKIRIKNKIKISLCLRSKICNDSEAAKRVSSPSDEAELSEFSEKSLR